MDGAGTRGRGIRVVVVADEPAFRSSVETALGDALPEADVRGVSSEWWRASGDAVPGRGVDAVVCSDDLGAVEPFALVSRLRDRRPELPVYLLAEDPAAVADVAVEAGVTDYFPRVTADAQYELMAERIGADVRGSGRRPRGRPGRPRADGGEAASDLAIEEQFRLVTEHVDELIFITRGLVGETGTGEGTTEYMSPAFETIYGRPVESVYEDPSVLMEAVHPDDTEEYREFRDRMTEDARSGDLAESYGQTFRIRRPDGEVRWLEGTVYPVETGGTDDTGDRWWVGITRDVTEREQLEQEVRERERTYREIFEGVTDGLVVHDPETGEIVDVNQRYCEMNGYDREELVGADVGLVTAPDEDYSFEEARERIHRAREEGPQLFEWRNQHADGTTFPVEVNLSIARIHGEEHVLASVRDITERKRREREYEQIFDGVNDAIVVIDPGTGDIVDVNERMCELVGYDREEIREQGIAGLSVAEEGYTAERGMAVVDRVMASGEPETLEWKAETADGERRWLEVNATPATIDGEPRYLAIQRDITERKRRERIVRALHESTEDLQNAETAEAVCEAAVDAARDVLDLSMPICWLHAADESNVLTPVAATEEAWNLPLDGAGPGEFEPGDFEYDVYEGDEMSVYEPSGLYEETSLDRAFLVPLGDHGLLGAAEPGVDSFADITLDAARILARHVTAALDRVQRARELRESERRFRQIAERIDEVIYLGPLDLEDVYYINPAYEDIWGRPVDELYERPRSYLEHIHPDDREAYREQLREMLAEIRAGNPSDHYEFEYRIRRPDGEVRWLESMGYPVLQDGDEEDRFVGVVEDVTEEKRRREALETFHDATRELTEAESRVEAADLAVEAAQEVLGFPFVSVYLHDDSDGQLHPAAATTPDGGGVDGLSTVAPGENLAWQAFVEGEAVHRSDTPPEDGGSAVPGATDFVLPLGSHGVMLVGADGSADDDHLDLAQVLAATTQAGLGHVEGERELEEREAELQEQVERAERLDRLNTIIRDIEQATVEKSTREEIERAVPERLTDVEPYRLAWIGTDDLRDDGLDVRASAGDGRAPDRLEADDAMGPHPAVEAVESGEVVRSQAIAADAPHGDWQKRALRRGHQSIVAVPLAHEDTTHGVLVVAASEPGAFDEEETTVLAELGRSVAHAFTVLERKRALESDTTVELSFRVADERLLFVALSGQVDARVDLKRTVRRAEGTVSGFFAVEGIDPGEVVAAARTVPRVADAETVTEDDRGGLLEVRLEEWFGALFTERGAVIRTARASGGEGRLTVEVPRAVDTRALVDTFQERYPDTDLVAKRERERPVRTLLELQDALQERLTDRQFEALETAYSAGYFEWPRDSSGEDIADLLDITQPTLNKHLRAAEREAFAMLLDRDTTDDRD